MSELEKPIIEYPDSYPPEACEDIAYRDERIKKLEAELIEAHSGAAYQAGKQDGIKWGEAERDRYREALQMVSDCIPRIMEDEMDRIISPESVDAVLEALKEHRHDK